VQLSAGEEQSSVVQYRTVQYSTVRCRDSHLECEQSEIEVLAHHLSAVHCQ
jgi:hypothetical protein